MSDSFSYSQRLTIAIVPRLVALLLRTLHRTLRYEVVVEPGVTAIVPPVSGTVYEVLSDPVT